jgi:hypothetical protein
MQDRVARTKTSGVAWELVRLLEHVCPRNRFAVVMLSPKGGYEVIPDLAFHPLDRLEAEKVVRAFVLAHAKEEHPVTQ